MVEVGKFTLESLTTGMYSDPRIVYREYIQNAVDSIEAAISENIISEKEAYINVLIDAENGTITIEDNGRGVPAKTAESILLSIGKSTKRQENNRGFRGIGRLGGLSYCGSRSPGACPDVHRESSCRSVSFYPVGECRFFSESCPR